MHIKKKWLKIFKFLNDLRHKLHCNNYSERITSAPKNLDRRIEDNTWKLTTVYLPYIQKDPKDM